MYKLIGIKFAKLENNLLHIHSIHILNCIFYFWETAIAMYKATKCIKVDFVL